MNAPVTIGHNGGPAFADRWYQDEAVEALFQFFASHGGTDGNGVPIPANPLVCLPTGTGKSIVNARFFQRALMQYPSTRAIMSTHVKELIEQNAKKMLQVWPHAPLGIHSAGLKQRDFVQPIIFGGIKSMVGKGELFGRRDFLVVDEAHLIPGEGDSADYLKFIEELRVQNPYLKVIGLTATDYRLGLGRLTNGKIFTHKAYDLTDIDGFNRLMAEGFLAPLIPKRTNTELDVSGVGMSKGEYNLGELQNAVDTKDVNFKALREIVEAGHDRWSWLLFSAGVEHAEHLAEMLGSVFGIEAVAIHSKMTQAERDRRIELFKTGQVRCAISNNVLTTGFDHPPVDLIGMLRPTMSTGLWVQMLGRGTRPYSYLTADPELARLFPFIKANCLVLDFAGNTRRLGPINDPVIPRMKGQGKPGDAPVRICSVCGVYNHATARVCIACGTAFEFGPKLTASASEAELIRSDLPVVEWIDVNRVVAVPHTAKATGRKSIKVMYHCGLQQFNEWITVEGTGLPAKRGRDWFRQRYGEPWEGITDAQVLSLMSQMRAPRQIRVWLNKKYPEVLGYEF